jgi:hypothetical protein
MIPISATECTCHKCGAEFYVGRTNLERPDDYLMPDYCPMCGAAKSLSGVTVAATIRREDPSRAVDFDGECANHPPRRLVCGDFTPHKIHSLVGCSSEIDYMTMSAPMPE